MHCRRCAILAWLQRQAEPVTAEHLANVWGVSPRTARRYLRHWEAHGAASVVKFGKSMQWTAAKEVA